MFSSKTTNNFCMASLSRRTEPLRNSATQLCNAKSMLSSIFIVCPFRRAARPDATLTRCPVIISSIFFAFARTLEIVVNTNSYASSNFSCSVLSRNTTSRKRKIPRDNRAMEGELVPSSDIFEKTIFGSSGFTFMLVCA